MKYEKGTSGNPKGRPQGAQGKLTTELRAQLKLMIEGELERLPDYLATLPDPERLQIVLKLLPFVLPKVSQVSFMEGEPLTW